MPKRRVRRFPRSVRKLKLELPSNVLTTYLKSAKSHFPKEHLAYLFGHDLGHTILVSDLWIPDNQTADVSHVQVPGHFDWEAAQLAVEEDLQVVGDIHSHPWRYSDMKKLRTMQMSGRDHSPSEQDWEDRFGYRWITGICCIDETRSGALRASVRFWGPTVQLEEIVT